MPIVRNISKGLAKYVCVPINVRLALFAFSIRHFSLGFVNANKFIERLSKPCIIPILRKYGATIGENCDIETGLIFHNCSDYLNLLVGNNCHIGKNCLFDLRSMVIIENNVTISMKTTIITHQDLGNSDLISLYPESHKDVIIKENCYIGVNTTILKGVTINRSSIVAASSLVTKDVIAYTIVGGIPAKELKKINGIKNTD